MQLNQCLKGNIQLCLYKKDRKGERKEVWKRKRKEGILATARRKKFSKMYLEKYVIHDKELL